MEAMQQALPYTAMVSVSGSESVPKLEEVASDPSETVRNLASENAVLVLARRGCCMCHVVKRLLLGLGVNPLVYEVDDEKEVVGISGDLSLQFPTVFIGGSLVGGLEWLIGAHITGELVPILRKAGALWL